MGQDADAVIQRAASRLPRARAKRLQTQHAALRPMLDPRIRPSPSFTSTNNPIHRPRDFYLGAIAQTSSVCEDFCRAILQDAVCFGYSLPDVCRRCRMDSEAEVPDMIDGLRWREQYRRGNCKFFAETGAWGGPLQEEW